MVKKNRFNERPLSYHISPTKGGFITAFIGMTLYISWTWFFSQDEGFGAHGEGLIMMPFRILFAGILSFPVGYIFFDQVPFNRKTAEMQKSARAMRYVVIALLTVSFATVTFMVLLFWNMLLIMRNK